MATRNKKGGGDVVLGGRHLMGFFALLVVMLGVAFTLGYLLGRNQYDPQLRAAASTVPATPDRPANSVKSAASPGLASAPDRAPDRTTDRAPDRVADHASTSKKNSPAHPPAPPRPDWDFYHSGEPAKPTERLAPQPSAPPNAPLQPNRSSPATVPVADHPSAPVTAKPSAHGTTSSPKLSAGSNARSSRETPSGGTRPKDSAPNSKTSSTTSSTTPSAGSKFIPHGSTVLQVAAVVRQADALSLAQALQKKKFPAFVVPPDADRYYRVQVGPYGSAQSANAAQQQLEKQGFKSIIKR